MEAFGAHLVTQIACGFKHLLAIASSGEARGLIWPYMGIIVASSGEVFAWGEGKQGQLGAPVTAARGGEMMPRKVTEC